MSINFFTAACQEPPLNNSVFGLCDDNNGQKAYTNTADATKWIATVKNENKKQLVFTAIDIPEMTPPPPIGTTIVSTSGNSAKISKPIVPCPAII